MSGAARAGPVRLAALALLTCSLWPTRADNASQEYYTALINVTVQEPGRGAPLTFRIDRGRYGLDSPKAEVRGQVLAPLPIHGGECWAGAEAGRTVGGGPYPPPRPPCSPLRSADDPRARSHWCAARPVRGCEGDSRAWLGFPLLKKTWRTLCACKRLVYGRALDCEFAGTAQTKETVEERKIQSRGEGEGLNLPESRT